MIYEDALKIGGLSFYPGIAVGQNVDHTLNSSLTTLKKTNWRQLVFFTTVINLSQSELTKIGIEL